MRILLNATAEELERLGGDFTLYRDWLRLSTESMAFELIPSNLRRRRQAFLRKVSEKVCRTWQPTTLRRRLFVASRFRYVPPQAIQGIDVIVSHILFPWMPFPANVPVVWSSQGISPAAYYERYNQGRWTVKDVGFLYRTLGKRADALLISTESCAQNVNRWCPELADKIRVVPVPVFVDTDGDLAKPSAEDGMLRLLFVGVDADLKGLPEVLEAYRALKRKYACLRLTIVSCPSAKLRREIDALRGVDFHGPLPHAEVKALMARADIFVLPTHADTYALSAVEAMAHKCAVIISDLPPLPEIIPNGVVGFTAPAGDVHALVEKIEALVANLELLRQFQENAWQRYLSYHSPSVVLERLLRVFEQVVSHRRRRQPELVPQAVIGEPRDHLLNLRYLFVNSKDTVIPGEKYYLNPIDLLR